MEKHEIRFLDVNRWLFGETPPEFLFEVMLRTIILFLFLLVIVRLMGKRMAGQMTLTEMAVMVAIGAIVSPAMQLPDRSILMGMLVLVATLVFQRGLNLAGVRNRRIERLTQGSGAALVKDGILQVSELEQAKITRQQLFAMLRQQGIFNLAQVERAYLEANGLLTVYKSGKNKPGLPTYPHTDGTIRELQQPTEQQACCSCGHIQKVSDQQEPCPRCGASEWTNAYLQKAS